MIADLTGLPLANASLLDEGTAAAEAMAMCQSIVGSQATTRFSSSEDCHPQTIAVVQTRAKSLGIKLVVGDAAEIRIRRHVRSQRICAAFSCSIRRPMDGSSITPTWSKHAHDAGALVVFATDLLALTLIKPPGEFGADIAVGTAQRFGVPMGFGGPHAAFMSCKTEYVRKMPGRIIGVSKDANGNPAYRLTLQTREQHIRREKATSNICTAQVLLAIMAGMYAVYHGPDGLKRIAQRVHALTALLAAGLKKLGHTIGDAPFFDTLRVQVVGVPSEFGHRRRAGARDELPAISTTATSASRSTKRRRARCRIDPAMFHPARQPRHSRAAIRSDRKKPEMRPLSASAFRRIRSFSPIPSSTRITAKPRCCVTSSSCNRAICRWRRR